MLLNEAHEPGGAKELAFGIGSFGDAIGVEHENITRFEGNAPFVIVDFFKNAEGEASQLDFVAACAFVEKRLRLSRHSQREVFGDPFAR